MRKLTKDTTLKEVAENNEMVVFVNSGGVGFIDREHTSSYCSSSQVQECVFTVRCSNEMLLGNGYTNQRTAEKALEYVRCRQSVAIVTLKEFGQLLAGLISIPENYSTSFAAKVGDTVKFTYNEKARVVSVKEVGDSYLLGRDQYEPETIKRFNVDKMENFVNLDSK